MSLLDEKLEEISLKVKKLIEQNAQFRRVVQDLTQQKKALEAENRGLKVKIEELESAKANLPFDKESLQQQIDTYIQELDLSIEWLSGLD
jgi:chromosome segregation ATPase